MFFEAQCRYYGCLAVASGSLVQTSGKRVAVCNLKHFDAACAAGGVCCLKAFVHTLADDVSSSTELLSSTTPVVCYCGRCRREKMLLFCVSVAQHDIQKQPVTARMDEKLQQTMTLTARRLDIHQQVHPSIHVVALNKPKFSFG